MRFGKIFFVLYKKDKGVNGTKLDLFFSAKDNVLPVWVEVRSVLNGYPSAKLLPFGRKVLEPSEVNIDDNTDGLTITSTDADATNGPGLRLFRNSASPADSDDIGRIIFSGENDASEEINYMTIQSLIADETDGTEDGYFTWEKLDKVDELKALL